jgi:hypothetical protein
MRIPKYRVYIKHWGDLNDEFVYIKEGELHIYFRNWEQNMYESVVFQQFTGVKDSKGVDIYEGDLIESPYDRIPFVVEYVTDSYRLRGCRLMESMMLNLKPAIDAVYIY